MNLKKFFQLIFSIQNKCGHKQICLDYVLAKALVEEK